MNADVEGFLKESTGVNGDAPWSMADLEDTPLFQAYQDAASGAQQAQKVVVAQAHEIAQLKERLVAAEGNLQVIDNLRARLSSQSWNFIDLTKETEGLRQENLNLRDELERVREELLRSQLMLENARNMRDLAERRLEDGDL